MTNMTFPSEHYFQTANQRMQQALLLHNFGTSYSLAIYVGGVAVESLLRAFKGLRDPTFDERHDLLRLFFASGLSRPELAQRMTQDWSSERIESYRRELKAAINEIYVVWNNNYRFVSEERLRSHFKSLSRNRRIKGDCLKDQSRRFLNSVQKFINLGVMQWPTQ
jgi:hypothetical protein